MPVQFTNRIASHLSLRGHLPPMLAALCLLLLTACALPTDIVWAETPAACKAVTPGSTALPALTPDAVTPARQWQVHEVALDAGGEYANPYTTVAITATFRGPDDTELQVPGFWDGDNRFVVRFTPTLPGDWSYTTHSTPADEGLTQTGTFTVTAAAADATGFLRRDPEHPYSFVYDNGTRYFMMGNTYYDLMRTACAGSEWQDGVVWSAAYGINKVRIFVHSLGFGQDHQHPDYYPAVFPFVADDHNQLNLAYWRKLDEVVMFLAAQGTVADLILFMKPTNTEDDLAFGTPAQDERYVRYILARYAAFPNVIWCLTNEWEFTGRDEAYWDKMGALVRDTDPWLAQGDALRPLSLHNATNGKEGGKFAFFDSDWPVHAIVQYGVRNGQFQHGDEWGNYSIVQNRGHDMPVVNDEYGYIGEPQPIELTRSEHRRALWGVVIGGGYAAAGDFRIFNDGPNRAYGRVIMTGRWHDAPEYGDIRRLVRFWTEQGIPYWQMGPQNERITAGKNVYVLGDGASEFVVYAAAGGSFKLDLPEGQFRVSRFDPRTGELRAISVIRGGDTIAFTLPNAQDWVLRLTAN